MGLLVLTLQELQALRIMAMGGIDVLLLEYPQIRVVRVLVFIQLLQTTQTLIKEMEQAVFTFGEQCLSKEIFLRTYQHKAQQLHVTKTYAPMAVV